MSGRYILGIDQSTQGTKALLIDENGCLAARADVLHKQYVDSNGWVEHDPLEILRNTVLAARKVFQSSGIAASETAAVALSNQRETCVAWDRETGRPVHNAIVWQCPRAREICEAVEKDVPSGFIKERTGLNLSPYFSAGKIAWLIRNIPSARELLRRNNLCCGTVDSWLVRNLTREKAFLTDYSNASRTQLYNLNELSWDTEVCSVFDIAPGCLAKVCFSDACYGHTDLDGLLSQAVPVHAVLGDSHASLFAHGCRSKGMVKATYGTGSSVMMHTGEAPIMGSELVASIAWGAKGKLGYVMEGNLNYTGAIVSWLTDDLKLISDAAEIGKLAALADEKDGAYLVPAFSGLGAPYWKPGASALLCGMTRLTGRNEIAKAAEEAIAYQIADIIFLMERESNIAVSRLNADGGATRDSFLMQFQSDILGKEVCVSSAEELSGIGAACMAGIAMGLLEEDALSGNVSGRIYRPAMAPARREEKYEGWKAAVHMAIGR